MRPLDPTPVPETPLIAGVEGQFDRDRSAWHALAASEVFAREVVAIGAAGSLVLWVEELRKYLVRRRLRAEAPGAST